MCLGQFGQHHGAAVGHVDADGLLAVDDALLDLRGKAALQVLDFGRGGVLRDRDPRAGRIQQADRLVGQLPGGDVAMRQLHRRLDAFVQKLDLVVLFQNAGDAAAHQDGLRLRVGFVDLDGLKAAGQRRSGSICCLYSAQVVAAMVRNSPRASAGFSRLAASPVPAAPPAPIRGHAPRR